MPALQAPYRAALGFVAGVVSTLTFHQAMWTLLHYLAIPGMLMPPPFPMVAMPPFGVPLILSLAFWAGLYGAVYGVLLPRLTVPMWLSGLVLGLIAGLVGMTVVAAIKGMPILAGGQPAGIARSLLINGFWGIGVAVILPVLARRRQTA